MKNNNSDDGLGAFDELRVEFDELRTRPATDRQWLDRVALATELAKVAKSTPGEVLERALEELRKMHREDGA